MRKGFTLIELLIVIAIIAILAVVVVLTLNPAQLMAQSRDANRVSDMATLNSAINLYNTDQIGGSSFSLGTSTNTYISIPDSSSTCGDLSLPSLGSSTWACSTSANYRIASSTGWLPVNFTQISAGAPFGSLPIDPVNQTSSGLFYAYNTNGSQFEVTADLESAKYKQNYGITPQTNLFPEVVSAGTPTVSTLYNPSGLAGYWPLNEGTGTTALDQSGGGNSGTWQGGLVNGSHYAAGKVGGYAGNFDGNTNTIKVGTSTTDFGTGSFSIALWVYASSPMSSYGMSLWNGGSSAGYPGYSIGETSSGWQLSLSDGTTVKGLYFLSSAINQWVYFTAVINRTSQTAYTYVNGVQMNSTGIGTLGSLSNINYSFYLGSESGASYFMTGQINDLRIYSRALSSAEVMALYNAEK